MIYNESVEFKKDFKKLLKRYRTLKSDLALFKKVLEKSPRGNGKHFVVLTETNNYCVMKARLFSQSLRGNSLRIVYILSEEGEKIEFIQVDFVEIFFKGDKPREDISRIKKYLD